MEHYRYLMVNPGVVEDVLGAIAGGAWVKRACAATRLKSNLDTVVPVHLFDDVRPAYTRAMNRRSEIPSHKRSYMHVVQEKSASAA